jgi:NTP pyrophosphatase (non-canonical NTP hydrolase)
MKWHELINRNYSSTVNRQLITSQTDFFEFTDKILEEVAEIEKEMIYGGNWSEEIADVILVALNMATHYKIDIRRELENKIIKNEKR